MRLPFRGFGYVLRIYLPQLLECTGGYLQHCGPLTVHINDTWAPCGVTRQIIQVISTSTNVAKPQEIMSIMTVMLQIWLQLHSDNFHSIH